MSAVEVIVVVSVILVVVVTVAVVIAAVIDYQSSNSCSFCSSLCDQKWS